MAQKSEGLESGVTIGIPLFNEELFIEEAIRSAAPQCERLLISDNGSSDRSFAVCEALAKEYGNIQLVRQERNRGALENFKFLLEKADTPYFMWLGAHDVITRNYVESLREELDSDAGVVLAFGSVCYVDRVGNPVGTYEYFFSPLLALEDAHARFLGIIRHLHDCSLIYGLFRRDTLLAAWVDAKCLAGDHLLLGNASLAGRLKYVPATCFIRRCVRADDSAADQLKRISGPNAEGSIASYVEMQKRQFKTALCAQVPGLGRKLWFIVEARFWLVARFGKFASGRIGRVIDGSLLLISRVRRVLINRI